MKAKQFAFGEAIAGVLDLLVVTTKSEVIQFRQAGLGSGWVKTDPQPFIGDKIQQRAAVDSLGKLQLVGLTTSAGVIRQWQMSAGNLNWSPPQTIAGLSTKHVAVARFLDAHDARKVLCARREDCALMQINDLVRRGKQQFGVCPVVEDFHVPTMILIGVRGPLGGKQMEGARASNSADQVAILPDRDLPRSKMFFLSDLSRLFRRSLCAVGWIGQIRAHNLRRPGNMRSARRPPRRAALSAIVLAVLS